MNRPDKKSASWRILTMRQERAPPTNLRQKRAGPLPITIGAIFRGGEGGGVSESRGGERRGCREQREHALGIMTISTIHTHVSCIYIHPCTGKTNSAKFDVSLTHSSSLGLLNLQSGTPRYCTECELCLHTYIRTHTTFVPKVLCLGHRPKLRGNFRKKQPDRPVIYHI